MNPPQLIILDLDGTLASLQVDWESLRNEIKDFYPSNQHPDTESLTQLIDEADPAKRNKIIDLVASYETKSAQEAPLNTALLQWLEKYPQAHLGILTLNSRFAAQAVARRCQIQERIIRIIGREDDIQKKPQPHGLLAIAQTSGTSVHNCLMIGDSDSDQQAAHAAGVDYCDVRVIGTDWNKGKVFSA